MRIPSVIAGCAAAALLVAAAMPAAAQDQGEGKRFAESHCAKCHAIGPQGDSPLAKAPPFRAIAAKGNVDNLQEALAEGIVVGHEAMPEFELEPQQIAGLLDYLKSLAPAR
jgi:mono/diheme cytochrome c family protein